MTTPWTDALALVVVQHLWLSALCFLLSGLVRRSHRLGAVARSRLSLCLVMLAAVLPLAVFVPGDRAVEVASTSAHAHEVIDVAPPSPLETAVAPASTAVTRDAPLRPALEALAIGVWLVGFAWCLHRLLLGRHEAGRLRHTASAAPALEQLLARNGADRATIRISDQVHAPMVVGVRRPCILVPRNLVTELPEEILLGLLRHEMAHIRRRDLWITLGQRLGQAVYWWSPLFRLLGARLDLAREMACDAEAAARSGGGRSYAQALLTCAERLAPGRHVALSVGMLETGLSQRIDALLLMDDSPRASGVVRGLGLVALTAVGVALGLGATPRVRWFSCKPATTTASVEVLLEAAKLGRVDEVRHLVAAGVGVNARLAGDRPSGTALIQAARSGNLAMVDELLRLGADVDQPSLRDGNPLIVAAMNGHLDVVQRLVAAGADVNAIVKFDETPLINASREGHLAIVAYLIEHGADVNLGVLADEDRWRSPLNQAHGAQVRDYLIARGAAER
jgi:beta-lactamase regulating signal transducer with metallopeptidase domain